jgi:hypothetical protein
LTYECAVATGLVSPQRVQANSTVQFFASGLAYALFGLTLGLEIQQDAILGDTGQVAEFSIFQPKPESVSGKATDR